jgi:hypothetical protein
LIRPIIAAQPACPGGSEHLLGVETTSLYDQFRNPPSPSHWRAQPVAASCAHLPGEEDGVVCVVQFDSPSSADLATIAALHRHSNAAATHAIAFFKHHQAPGKGITTSFAPIARAISAHSPRHQPIASTRSAARFATTPQLPQCAVAGPVATAPISRDRAKIRDV